MDGAGVTNVASRNGPMQPTLLGAMVLAGIATTMLGPLLPRLESRWHIGDAEAGLLFTGLFLASVITGALVGPLASRWGHPSVVRIGLIFTSVGAALVAVSPWPQAVGAVAIVGCGLGLSIPAANLAADGPQAVMLVNCAWSIGAVGGPLLLASFPRAFLWGLSGALACAAVVGVGASTRIDDVVTSKVVMSRSTMLTAAFLFLYVGAESSLDGWLSSYASRNASARGLWAALPSIFWIGILIGRFLATIPLRRLVPGGLLSACLVVAFSGVCLLLVAPYGWAILAAAGLTGLAMAPIFPLAVAKYAESTKGEQAAGLIFSAGGLGGASVPPLVGYVSEFSGSLRLGMAIAPALFVTMLLLWTISGLGRGSDQTSVTLRG